MKNHRQKVRPSVKMKTFTNVNQGKKQNVCVAFCLNNYLVSYVKSTVYMLTLKKLDPAHTILHNSPGTRTTKRLA